MMSILVWLLIARQAFFGVKGFIRGLRQGLAEPPIPRRGEYGGYVLLLASGMLYVGASSAVRQRIAAHKDGRGAKVTQEDQPVEVIEVIPTSTMREALIAERTLYDKYVAAGFTVKGAANTQRPSVIDARRPT